MKYKGGKPPRSKSGQPARVRHLRTASLKHGASACDVHSTAAYLQAIARFLGEMHGTELSEVNELHRE